MERLIIVQREDEALAEGTNGRYYGRPTTLRTIGHPSARVRSSYCHTAFFEKNAKEPKKNGKRTEKERNSVTTAVGQLPVEGENFCRAKDQSVCPTVRKRRLTTEATSNRKTGCKDTKIKIK
jgi:hypothetical protein